MRARVARSCAGGVDEKHDEDEKARGGRACNSSGVDVRRQRDAGMRRHEADGGGRNGTRGTGMRRWGGQGRR